MTLKNFVSKLNLLVIGCGSIGERHIYNLKKMGVKKLAICDIDKQRSNYVSKKYKIKNFYDLNSALAYKPDVSFICTYPTSHVSIAKNCIQSNSHVFIEKPISSNLKGVRNLLQTADRRGVKVAVGYNTRFDKGLNLIKKQLQKSKIFPLLSIHSQFGNNIRYWHPGTKFQEHYILKKGSGIILDDSHEYDYIRWLLNDEVDSVYCQIKKMKSIKTQTDSLASFLLKFKNGVIANLITDYVRPKYERHCEIIGEKGSFTWEQIPLSKSSWKNYSSKLRIKTTRNLVRGQISYHKTILSQVNETYEKEIEHFFSSIKDDKKSIIDGWSALKTLEIGIAALKSATQNKIIKI